MRVLALICGIVAAPAAAGTVSAIHFGGSAATTRLVAGAVAAEETSGFVLYRHGARVAEPARADSGAADAAAADGYAGPFTAADARTGSELFGDPCRNRSSSRHAGVSGRALIGRLTYGPLVRAAECRHGLPPGLLDAVVWQESRYRPYAMSAAGAGGLAQLMPKTAAGLGVADRFDPASNLDAGARYLRSMLDTFRSVPLALAAYNAGGGAVRRWGGIPRNAETPGYVRAVLGFWQAAALTPLDDPAPLSRAVTLSFIGSSRE